MWNWFMSSYSLQPIPIAYNVVVSYQCKDLELKLFVRIKWKVIFFIFNNIYDKKTTWILSFLVLIDYMCANLVVILSKNT